jgi:hypothetical protein
MQAILFGLHNASKPANCAVFPAVSGTIALCCDLARTALQRASDAVCVVARHGVPELNTAGPVELNILGWLKSVQTKGDTPAMSIQRPL